MGKVRSTGIEGSDAATAAAEQDPLDWWLVFSGLLALILSWPLTGWVQSRFDGIPPALSFWVLGLSTIAMSVGIGWFLIRVPRPSFDSEKAVIALLVAPILLMVGVVGNVLTLGFGAPAVAYYLVSEISPARRRADLT